MLLRDLILFAFNALKDRKLRAVLTIIGIVIGPATIVALVGATQGFTQSISAQFENIGANTMMVMPQGRDVHFTANDVEDIGRIADVQSVIPFYRVAATIKYSGSSSSATIIALDTDSLETLFPGIDVADGKIPGHSEFTSAVIGFQLANPSDPETKSIELNQVFTTSSSTSSQPGQPGMGERTNVAARSFLVVGVLGEFGQGLFINPDDTIFVPFDAGRLLTGSTYYSGLYVVASKSDAVTSISEAISETYGSKARVITISSILSTIESVTGSMTTMLVSIAAISVVVAFMGIMTTMFTSINERTREIGVIKALGYSSRAVMFFFLTEAVLTGFIGGVIGSLAGAVASFFAVSIFGGGFRFGGFGGFGGEPRASQASLVITPAITPELIFAAILMATAVGALAGIAPAWRASRLTPVEALRHE